MVLPERASMDQLEHLVEGIERVVAMPCAGSVFLPQHSGVHSHQFALIHHRCNDIFRTADTPIKIISTQLICLRRRWGALSDDGQN